MTSPPARALGLPARYEQEWGTEFWSLVDRALRPGVAVLDIGAGRRPTIPPQRRPPGSHYVGLDLSGDELRAAPAGSYDELVVTDAQSPMPDLFDRFDLIVSWQVLEHIRDLPRAMEVFQSYAKVGGSFVACLSGRNAVFSHANRILPAFVGSRLVALLMRRPVETVFPAFYDHCNERGLHSALRNWDAIQVIPLWRGADYFAQLGFLRGLYIRYEDWAIGRGLTNLATHYVIAARNGEDRG
jgi:2-polyprenyl-6-hydroxyphenyl methylase/3-demethylubiquinone-9 3-methyltransferase